MNQNRPFYSTNTNLYDESFRSSAPTTLNGENVILSQEQLRRVCNTLNTSVVGNPFGISGNQQIMCAQKQYVPGGVLFTFPPSPMAAQNVTPGTYCKCTPMSIPSTLPSEFNYLHQPSTAVNTFFPSSMEYQQVKGYGGFGQQQALSRDPFQLKFHHDCGTSTSDLLNHFTQVPASKGFPDLCNITGVLQQLRQIEKGPANCQMPLEMSFSSPPIEFSSNAKKLVLSKSVLPPCNHVVDVLDEKEKNGNSIKKVSFSDPNTPANEDKSFQITNDCICDAKKCKSKAKSNKNRKNTGDGTTNKPKRKKEKKKEKPQSNTSSETTLSSDTDKESAEDDSENPKKKRWWNRRQKSDSPASETQSSDSEGDRPDSKKNKKRRAKKRKSKNNSVEGSQTDSATQPESTSEDCPRE